MAHEVRGKPSMNVGSTIQWLGAHMEQKQEETQQYRLVLYFLVFSCHEVAMR